MCSKLRSCLRLSAAGGKREAPGFRIFHHHSDMRSVELVSHTVTYPTRRNAAVVAADYRRQQQPAPRPQRGTDARRYHHRRRLPLLWQHNTRSSHRHAAPTQRHQWCSTVPLMDAQCFTDLRLIMMVRRYHLWAISVPVAVAYRARTIRWEIGAVRRDRYQSE